MVQTIIQCMVAYYLEAVVFKDTHDAFQDVSGQDNRSNNKAEDDSDKPSTSTPGCFTVLCSRFSRAQSNKSLDELAKKIDRIFTQLKLIHKEMGLDEAFSFESFLRGNIHLKTFRLSLKVLKDFFLVFLLSRCKHQL